MTLRNKIIMVAVVILPIFILMYHKYVFFSHDIEIVVVKNDAVEECYPRWTKTFGRKWRSSVPEVGFAGYCGAIFTTMGHYKLPSSSEYWGIHQGRAHLKNSLVDGCKYDVTAVGYGGKFKEGDKPRHPIRQQITWINRAIECPN